MFFNSISHTHASAFYFLFCSYPLFSLRFKNSCSGFSRSISVFRGRQGFVLKVDSLPPLNFLTSLCAGPAEIRRRYPHY